PPRRLRRGAAIPEAFYLIVLDEKEGQLRAQAFIFPQETPESARPDDFLASIDEIERRTGLDFLPDLSTEAQARIESARAARTW
ncbi:MAG TPA: DNA/RNA non-specific endonuclease, partial [Opitutaceae bacterium]|nr:DNA/RNA non-specific endonuclease [Opitutaceae bacterium]